MSRNFDKEQGCHISVMPEEVLYYLSPKPGETIVDCTTGEAGHSALIAERIGSKGKLICCDLDSELIEIAKKNLANVEPSVEFVNANYKALPEILLGKGIEKADGFLLDLGACSRHFDDPVRGFSFQSDAPLDMRYDRTGEKTAEGIVNRFEHKELERIFREYGEERYSRLIANAIERERRNEPIRTTLQLARIIESAVPKRERHLNPATRVFQALRIAVNDELGGLREFIINAARILNTGGKVVVISFHSLEDRIIKDTFNYLSKDCICPSEFPVCRCDKRKEISILTKKPIIPSNQEININPRSRSAKLRACVKLEI